jgi:hypothetical protein
MHSQPGNCYYQEVHALQVLQADVEPWNMLWDEQCELLMLVDFETGGDLS